MFDKNAIKKCFLLMSLAAICIAVLSLIGCGGGSDGDGGTDDDGSPAYSELDVSFGGVVLDHFVDQTLSLQNAGSISITLGDVEDPGAPFTIVTDGCSNKTLAASGTCDLQIRYSPTEQGDDEGFFSVPLSGSSTDFAGVNLDGTGRGLNVTITQVDTSNCSTIKLIAAVSDQYDDFVPGLENYFTLIEGGKAISSGATVVNDTSKLSVVLALDTSGSVSDVLGDIKDAAKAFIPELEAGQDEVAIYKFSETAEKISGFLPAGDSGLNTAIESITQATGYTALYDALVDVCDYIDNYATKKRQAIVLLTDGEDNSSDQDLQDAIDYAKNRGIPIFTIGMGAEAEYIEILQELAESTDGQYYDAPTEAVLYEVYPDIAELLTNQYEIEYTSNLSGGAAVTVDLSVTYNGMTGADSREFTGCP